MGNRLAVLSHSSGLPLLEGDGRCQCLLRRMAASRGYILQTFREQQRKEGNGPYHFQRKTERALDTVTNNDGAIR